MGMWAVGENCVSAMDFEISGFYSSRGQSSAHLFARMGPGPSNFFHGGRGGGWGLYVKF